MKVQYSIIYNRKGKLRKDGTALVQIRAYLNQNSKYFSTGVYITPEEWNARRKCVWRNPDSHHLNHTIRQKLSELQALEYELTVKQGGKFFLHQFDSSDPINKYKSFTQFYEEEMGKEDVRGSTLQTYTGTLAHLKAFKAKVLFEQLDYNLIRGFDAFLKKKRLGVNTRAKHHKNMKKFINLAIKMDLLDINLNPYKKFKVNKEKTSRIFLYEHEVERLEMLTFDETEEHLERVRDLFLFSCYTGLRYSDVSRLSKSVLKQSNDGWRLDMKSQKTGKHIQLPLHRLFKVEEGQPSKPELIVNLYIEKQKAELGDTGFYDDLPFFKGLSEPYVNRQLKVLALRAGIDKKLSTHIGRHTFGTNLALKVKPLVLQKLMQHSKMKETMIYVHLGNQMIENELEKVTW